ncbi:MAG: histidine phosphatase family protein [Microbacteriaceae bacterium]|nr:histidine phosphatase family protein [Microbacteriaceae bacterium]
MRLIFIRHAQTPSNVQGLLDSTHPGPGLTDLGHQQAAFLPDALEDEPIGAVVSSTLTRTQLTAEPLAIARGREVEVLPGLYEIQAGDLEMRADRDSARIYLETAFAWGSGDLDVRMPGAENGHEFFGRFDADIAAIEETGVSSAAIVSHGAAIRVWVAARATNVPPRFAADNPLDNTGIVILDGSMATGWTLLTWAGFPVGGIELRDFTAEDPTGETLSDVREG